MQDPLFATATPVVARIALPIPVDSLFDYAVPPELHDSAIAGVRATVNFSGRPLTGVIVQCVSPAEIPPGERRQGALASVEAILDSERVLAAPLMDALREQAAELLCPVGIALAAALPPGASPRSQRIVSLTPRGVAALESGALRGTAGSLLRALGERNALAQAALSRRVPNSGEVLAELEKDGLLRIELAHGAPAVKTARSRTVRVVEGIDVAEVCASSLARAKGQSALLLEIAEAGRIETRLLRQKRPGSDALVRALIKRSLVVVEEIETPRNVLGPPIARDQPAVLTPEQEAAFHSIANSVRAQKAETFLLHGVTGSGKTEVYLRAVAETLAAGRQALILVPEITLTHQIVARLRMRFGDDMAVLHSGLRPGERLEQWQRLRRGATPIAVGARSALFAPLERLGLIVIDEEHDGAYKNEEGFRYHARDFAAKRAHKASCPLLLGSATPSLESRHASDLGRMERLVLHRRIGGRPLPAVEIVDLARERERAPRGRKLILTRPLKRAMRETRERGEQTILFLNRRGFATQVMCFDCGAAEQCPNCDVTLVYHATEQHLTCHYCDHTIAPSESCRSCGAPDSALLGIGTERLEEEVRRAMPEAVIERLDRDTARRRGHTQSVLNGLQEGRVDVLIGTQMVAKGHDFPGVSLVGVIAADVGLHMPDFRAAERTFQLLTQVAGRAGRASKPGRVIVQTFAPEHYAIDAARGHDYERFYREEMGRRQELCYPPFSRLARFVFSGEDHDETLTAARRIRDEVAASLAPGSGANGVEVLGPAPAPLSRLRGRYRYQLVLKSADPSAFRAATEHGLQATAGLPRSVQSALDANPLSML